MKHISRGAPAKSSPHKGSWGDRYIIENPNQNKRMSCSKCVHYMDDKSCDAKAVYVPEIGYDYWKYCNAFKPLSEFEAYTKKQYTVVKTNNKADKINNKPLTRKPVNVTKNIQAIKPTDSKVRIFVSGNTNRCNSCDQKCSRMLVEYIKDNGKRRHINVAICPSCNKKYISKNHYENFISVNQNTNINFIYAVPKKTI